MLAHAFRVCHLLSYPLVLGSAKTNMPLRFICYLWS
jgi:hypothetical protein